jgi:hypothetical protein
MLIESPNFSENEFFTSSGNVTVENLNILLKIFFMNTGDYSGLSWFNISNSQIWLCTGHLKLLLLIDDQ